MSDSTLRQDVMDELAFEPSINSAHVGVSVDHDVVTLTGHVSTYAQKLAAEDVVRQVKGVRGIVQEIEVRPFGANKTADDEIAKRAIHRINWRTVVRDNAVQVNVENGWVTLSGCVEWQYQKTAVAEAIKDLDGIVGVNNLIEVKPPFLAADVKKRIDDALRRYAAVEAKGISINVDGSEVTLTGEVKAWSARGAAEHAAWSAPGVNSVKNRIAVS